TQFIVHTDLPGVNPRDVDISITGNVLTIRGERKSDVEEKKEGYLFHETSFGTFDRVLTLPEGVDASKVKATYRNGVLELTMPAKAEALPKKVPIEIEAETKKAA
ncbi:MAG: Hsp20/alpha crystallin family protein, partial [Deltaproteobacteria bacterium]|nr:Hsp20/alpha crystallin family protein [Deltaproteobacteria bacterium]